MPASFTSVVRMPGNNLSSYIIDKSEEAYLDTPSATIAANIQGGAHSRRVTVVLYPIVALKVGK
jgi:hypothetical protein